jgi:DNA-binding response OmpR family regulator
VKNLRVLVADDSELILESIRQVLVREGHDVTTVTGGSKALRLLKTDTFDLVIADINMPEGDGFELVGEIRARHAATRILVISGGSLHFTPAYYVDIARKLGAHAAILKPFNREMLLDGIAAAMGVRDEATSKRPA